MDDGRNSSLEEVNKKKLVDISNDKNLSQH